MRMARFAVMVALLGPLAPARGGATETAASDEPLLIGMPSVSAGHPVHLALYKGADEEARKLGARLVVADAMGDPVKQSNDVKDLVAKGVRGIVISPMPGLTPAIEDAVKAGVTVVTVDNKADTDKVLFHSGVDNAEVGRMAARYVIEKLGNKGSVIEIEGYPGWTAAVERKAGFDEVIKKSGVKILASQTAYFDRDQGKQVMSSLMKQYPEFDAVFAANDDMVVGAIDAMSAVDVDPASKVTIGVDGSPVALASIRIGKLGATIDQVPDKQARQAVDWLVRYLQKKAMPPQKVMFVAPELLTRDHQ